jgi:hypothetical protein
MDLNSIVTTIKQIFAIVAVLGGCIFCLKVFGVQVTGIPGSLMDWAAVTIGTSLASK